MIFSCHVLIVKEAVIQANPEKWGEPGSWGRGWVCGLADVILALGEPLRQVELQ